MKPFAMDDKTSERNLRACLTDVKGEFVGLETEASKPNIVWILVLTFAVLFAVANSTFVKVPNNMVVHKWKSPEAIDMSCKSDCRCNLKWFVRKNLDSEIEDLYNGYFLRQDAKSYCTVITGEPGKFDLNLTNKPEAAQTYICFDPRTSATVSADLIWIDDLTGNDDSTEDLVNLTCSMEFRGNWVPTMQWKEQSIHGERVLSVGVKTTTVSNQRVTSTVDMKVQEGSRNYTCTTKFNISGKSPLTTATNVPEYKRSWTFSVFTKSKDQIAAESVITTAAAITVGIGLPATTAMLVLAYFSRQKRKREARERVQPENCLVILLQGKENGTRHPNPESREVNVGL